MTPRAEALPQLDKVTLGRFVTSLENLGRGRARAETQFEIILRRDGSPLTPSVVSGLHFEGIGRWYRPWLEIEYKNTLSLEGRKVRLEPGEEEGLFKLLCDVLPPGSHIMVGYRNHKITAQALMFGVPPQATPLGYLLYQGGCRWFKDWYFAEGFMEGEEKLQGTKPLNGEIAARHSERIRGELRQYLEAEPDPSKPDLESICRRLARKILSA